MRYTSTVGQKFYADGSVRPFPGNTVLCMISPDDPIYERAAWLQQQFAAQPMARHFVCLPPASFHMTVMDLVCEEVRETKYWSRFQPLDTPLTDMDVFFQEVLRTVPTPTLFQMRYSGLSTGGGLRIDVVPADATTHQAIRGYRDAIAEVTGVRFPNHLHYGFHISLAYRLIEPDADEEAAIAAWVAEVEPILRETFGTYHTATPALSCFDDMVRFVPQSAYDTLYTRRPAPLP